MYSAKVLEHIESPRNVGEIAEHAVRGESTNPVCGDRLILTLGIEEDGTIREARFLVDGCPPSISAGSILTELLTGLSIDEARRLRARDISQALGGLPRNKEHCSVLAIDALRAAIRVFQGG